MFIAQSIYDILFFQTGDNKGELKVANVSTGRFLQSHCRLGGSLLSITSDTNGRIFWIGNNQVYKMVYNWDFLE